MHKNSVYKLYGKKHNMRPQNYIFSPYKVGEKYFIRSKFSSFVARLKFVFENELVFEEASLIADTGGFSNFLKGEYDKNLEVQHFVDDVILSRAAIVDATLWKNDLLKDRV